MGNMYERIKTWNPLGGECPHKCVYCSTHKLSRFPAVKSKYLGKLRIDLNAKQPKKADTTIFVAGQNDLFADRVDSALIFNILRKCNNPKVTYFFQTKNPYNFAEYSKFLPKNSILCTTIETDQLSILGAEIYNTNFHVPYSMERITSMKFDDIREFRKQITIEPIMEFLNIDGFVKQLRTIPNLEQVNIGANTYKKVKLPEPTKEEVLYLISELEKFVKVVQKTNLHRLLK